MKYFLIALLAFSLGSCCRRVSNGNTCDLLLDQCSNVVSGYVTYTNGYKPTMGADIIIQWSDDSFATHTYVGATINNGQGFPVIPFSFDASYTCGTPPSIQIRAFESIDRSDLWVLGDLVGRLDDSPTGNSSLTSLSAASATTLVINLDNPGAQ